MHGFDTVMLIWTRYLHGWTVILVKAQLFLLACVKVWESQQSYEPYMTQAAAMRLDYDFLIQSCDTQSIPIHQQGISCSVDQPHCSYVLKDGKVSQGCALLFYHLIFHSLNSRNTVLINQFAAHAPQVLQNRRNITAVPWSQREVFCHVQNSNWLFFWTLPKLLKIELLANFSERGDTNDYLSKIILSKVDR